MEREREREEISFTVCSILNIFQAFLLFFCASHQIARIRKMLRFKMTGSPKAIHYKKCEKAKTGQWIEI